LRPDRRREELGQAEELEEGGRGVLEPDAGLLRVRPAMLLQHLRGGLALGHASLLGWYVSSPATRIDACHSWWPARHSLRSWSRYVCPSTPVVAGAPARSPPGSSRRSSPVS